MLLLMGRTSGFGIPCRGKVLDRNGEGVISAARVFCVCRVGSYAAELFSSIMKHFKHREKPSFVLFF